jgi:hypothetical protein
MLLASRIRDGEVRMLVDQLRDRTAATGTARDENEAEQQILAAVDIQSALVSRIGQLVREMDQAD